MQQKIKQLVLSDSYGSTGQGKVWHGWLAAMKVVKSPDQLLG